MSMQEIASFFNHPFFAVYGGIATIGTILGAIATAFLAIKGVLPVWYRLGHGLSKRKIAIFADSEYDNLKNMLVDSKLFKEKNIIRVDKKSIKKASDITILLVHYEPFKEKINEVLDVKNDSDALIVYSPKTDDFIDNDVLKTIENQRNSTLSNFRGRLLNDVLVSMITTGYQS